MNFIIKNNTGSPIHYEKEIHSLCDFAQKRLGFQKPPSIFLNHDKQNANNTLAKTGYYDPNTMEIHVFATGRHPKDILRSISHELVHHDQHMRGDLDMHGYSGKGYAQKNPKLRRSEMEANDPMLFRDWEDSIKEKENTIYNERRIRKMSFKDWKNKELSENLNKKWGFKMDLNKLNEAHCGKRDDDGVDEAHCAGKRDDGEKEETIDEEKKPDFPDVDGDGDTKEPISKAQKDKKEKEGDKASEKEDDEEKDDSGDKKSGIDKLNPGLQAYMKNRMKKESINKDQIVKEVMRRVASKINKIKKGKK
mgnify:CR=1 FL=1